MMAFILMAINVFLLLYLAYLILTKDQKIREIMGLILISLSIICCMFMSMAFVNEAERRMAYRILTNTNPRCEAYYLDNPDGTKVIEFRYTK